MFVITTQNNSKNIKKEVLEKPLGVSLKNNSNFKKKSNYGGSSLVGEYRTVASFFKKLEQKERTQLLRRLSTFCSCSNPVARVRFSPAALSNIGGFQMESVLSTGYIHCTAEE